MRSWILVLMLFPGLTWAQTPPDDEGELVLAYTLDGVQFTTTLMVWESGFARLVVASFDSSEEPGTRNAEAVQTVVPKEDVQQLKKDLVSLGILKLDGQVTSICLRCLDPITRVEPQPSPGFAPFIPTPFQRVTFILRAPKRVHELVDRHPRLWERFRVYLRPREASFATVPETRFFSGNAFFVVNRITQFARETFPDTPLEPRDWVVPH